VVAGKDESMHEPAYKAERLPLALIVVLVLVFRQLYEMSFPATHCSGDRERIVREGFAGALKVTLP
jgi:hypothetical protein